jgi:Ribosomal protein L7/L12 C-terminal domain
MEVQKVTTNSINMSGAVRTVTGFVVTREGLEDQNIMMTEQEARELLQKLGKLLELRTPLPEEVQRLARKGKKLDAIKALRYQTGMGLKEAKDAVEEWLATQAHPDLEVGWPVEEGPVPAAPFINETEEERHDDFVEDYGEYVRRNAGE